MKNCVPVFFSNQFNDLLYIREYTVSHHHTWAVCHTRDIIIYCWVIACSVHRIQKTVSIPTPADAPFRQSIQWFCINLQWSIWFSVNFCCKSQLFTSSPSFVCFVCFEARKRIMFIFSFCNLTDFFRTKNSPNRCDLIKMFLTLLLFDLQHLMLILLLALLNLFFEFV